MNRLFAFVIAALTCHKSRDAAAAAVLGTVPSPLLLVRSLARTEKGFQLSQEDRETGENKQVSVRVVRPCPMLPQPARIKGTDGGTSE